MAGESSRVHPFVSRVSVIVRRWVGEDVFISYSRIDGALYAVGLANALAELGFTCFLDQWTSPRGSALPSLVLRALRRCHILVLVGTPAALSSPFVSHEVEFFARTDRPIVPI